MALRAGVPTADVEFVQFHPTALHHPAMPRPLLSEALRGHGALLRDRDGERFVDELAPRDVVSRAMAARMAEQGVDHLWLDATGLERFSARFPTIAASLASIGLDPQRDWLPDRAGGPPPLGRRGHRPVGRHGAARAVGRGRGGLHRRARGQPAGLQLAARGHGLRRPAGRAHPVGRREPRAERRAARRAGRRADRRHRVHARWRRRPRRCATATPDAVAGRRRDQAARHGAAGHDPRRRRRAQRRVAGRRARRRGRRRRRAGRRRRPRSPPASWPTCCGWRTRCWPPRLARTESRGAHARRRVPRRRPGVAPAAGPRRACAVADGAAPWRERRASRTRGRSARPSAAPWPRTSVPRAT